MVRLVATSAAYGLVVAAAVAGVLMAIFRVLTS